VFRLVRLRKKACCTPTMLDQWGPFSPRPMLLTYQLPVCDARRFVPGGDVRLVGPDWPAPTPGEEFVRSFGPVERRRRGGHEEFHDESAYADARGAVRFDRLEQQGLGAAPHALHPTVAYRRLLCSGRESGAAVVRLEMGFTTTNRRPGPASEPHFVGQDAVGVALDLLELPITVGSGSKGRTKSSLWTMGKPFADVYQRATTSCDQTVSDAQRRFVIPCQPLLLFEYEGNEIVSLPSAARAVEPSRIGGLDLSFVWIEYRRRQFGLWFLRLDPAQDQLCRRLRLGLCRIHAEHQVLKRALSLLLSDDLTYVRGAKESDLLDTYLASATRVLQRDEHGGFSHAAIQEVVAAYEAVVNPDELAILSERLEQVRRQIRGPVERYSGGVGGSRAAVSPASAESGDTIRVVVSYSHADKVHVDERDKYSLLSYLRGGLEGDRFRFWHDEQLQTGEQWNARIEEEIDAADVALVLVSQAFLNSRYCQDQECTRFLEARSRRDMKVFPIVLSPCDWASHAWLAATQFQPRLGATIETHYTDAGKRKQLYLEILEELRTIGKQIRASRP
jgi:hypothetical protein